MPETRYTRHEAWFQPVLDHLWGPVGSKVELFYRRPGIAGVSRVVLQRSAMDPRLTVTPSVQNGSVGPAGDN